MSTRRSLIWSYGSQAFVFLVSFISSVIVARILSPHDMGVFAIATATAGILYILTAVGFQSYLVREGEVSRDVIRSVFTINAILNIALAALIALLGIGEWYLFGEHAIGTVLMIAAIGPLMSIFEFVPAALYQREMNYGVLSRLTMVRAVITAISVVVCASAGLGPISPAIGPVFSGVYGVAYYAWRRPHDAVMRPRFKELRPILTFGFQIMSISGVAQISQRISDIILGRMLGLTALGLYSRASGLASLIFFNVYGLATGVVFAKMSSELRETGSLHATFTLSLRMITALVWPLMIGIAVLARPVIYLLYGAKWLPAALPLSFLMIAQFVVLGFGMNWELFVLRRETARQTRFEAFRAVAGLITFTVGCLFTIAAAAIGRIAEAVVGYLLYRPHIDRLAGTAKGELEGIFVESLVLTAVATTPSLLLMLWMRWAPDTSPLLITAGIFLGVAGWLWGLTIRRHPLIDEMGLVLGKVRSLVRAARA